jgi:hypothetical protein
MVSTKRYDEIPRVESNTPSVFGYNDRYITLSHHQQQCRAMQHSIMSDAKHRLLFLCLSLSAIDPLCSKDPFLFLMSLQLIEGWSIGINFSPKCVLKPSEPVRTMRNDFLYRIYPEGFRVS